MVKMVMSPSEFWVVLYSMKTFCKWPDFIFQGQGKEPSVSAHLVQTHSHTADKQRAIWGSGTPVHSRPNHSQSCASGAIPSPSVLLWWIASTRDHAFFSCTMTLSHNGRTVWTTLGFTCGTVYKTNFDVTWLYHKNCCISMMPWYL